ncbi:uncharacterized protein LOC109821392 [Asparagus officinalis]|uniref:uncharacterized protein LOC109821392 n=1 Tax=Asparagus officinalis TaxID=4686 RepID=UPI00098E6556|nr:uncharacterized protein LOC109821392 [Asparagus officinalis]
MARKKKFNGKRILNLGLRASNSDLCSSDDQSVGGLDEEEDSIIMNSTGPQGAKKKKSIAKILNAILVKKREVLQESPGQKNLILRMVLGLNIRFKAMEVYVKKIWANIATLDIFILKPGIFLFKFENKDEMTEILENGPWFFGYRPLSLKPLSIGDDYEKINDCVYPVWILLPALKLNLWNAKMLLVVQLPLKLNLWNAKSISKIASAVGRPITIDKLTANKQRLAYARVLVEVSMPSPLPDCITLKGPDGKLFNQKILYELKPRCCNQCKLVGHDTLYCKRFPRVQRLVPKIAVPAVQNAQKVSNPSIIPVHVSSVNENLPKIQTTTTLDLLNNSMHMLNISQRSGGKDKASAISLSCKFLSKLECLEKISNKIKRKGCLLILMMYKESKYAEYHNFQGCTVWCNPHDVQGEQVCRIPQFSGLHSLVHGVHAQHTDPMQNTTIFRVAQSGAWSLLETKIKDTLLPGITRKIAKTWNWMSNVRSSMKSFDGKLDCVISSIYGFNHLYARKVLWSDLKPIHQTVGSTPWLLCGDFNSITSNEEKIGGSMLTDFDTEDFRAFINDCQLAHLKTIGQVQFLVPKISDHSPGLITVSEECSQGKRPFKIFKMWKKHDCFLPTVANAWQQRIKGGAMFSVCLKLKNLKIALKDINRKFFYNISEQVHHAKQTLEDVQKDLQVDPMSPNLIKREKECISKYNTLMDCELSFFKQKARIDWSVQGDRCTEFFQSMIEANMHHNRVMLLYNNLGQRLTEGDDIVNEFITHFKSLMGTTVDTTPPNINIIHSGPCLDDSQARDLIASSVVGDEVTQAVDEFFKTGKLLGKVNSTAISLIPKVNCPTTPLEFRPISCCNVLYKFISKILANRIRTVIGSIINDAQSAFVEGRQTTNNILLAHELIKNYSRKYVSPRVMLSIDIKKHLILSAGAF